MTSTEPRTITGPEMKVLLGGLGISPGWFGSHLGVTMRTVVRWFDGDPIPQRAMDAVDALCTATNEEIELLRKLIDRRRSVVTLKTFRTDEEFPGLMGMGLPASWHRQIVFRLMTQLRAEGKTVVIEYA
jgi:hypothetical protein